VADDSLVRAYFDARAPLLDRLYDPTPGARGRFESWVYAPLRRRLALTLEELGDLTGKHVLDVGCGPGRYAVSAAERGANVVGIDISPAMLDLAARLARARAVSERCRFVQVDFDAYEPDARFDVVLMLGFVEYRADPRRQLARLHYLTREKAILSVPLPLRWQTIARRVRHRLRSSPPFFYVHRPDAIARYLEEVGFDSWRSDRGWFVALRR
jgi:SAM-dependent methyltransferase